MRSRRAGASTASTIDHDLDEAALRALVARFLGLYEAHTGESFPEDPREQLRQAILAVFDSWNNERAAPTGG